MGAKISSRGKFRRKPSRHQKTALSGPAPLGLLLRKILLRTRKTLPPRRRHFPCNPLKKTTRKKNEASEEQRFQKPRRPIFTVIGESLSAYLQAVINIARTKKTVNKKIVFLSTNRKKKINIPNVEFFVSSERTSKSEGGFLFAKILGDKNILSATHPNPYKQSASPVHL